MHQALIGTHFCIELKLDPIEHDLISIDTDNVDKEDLLESILRTKKIDKTGKTRRKFGKITFFLMFCCLPLGFYIFANRQ